MSSIFASDGFGEGHQARVVHDGSLQTQPAGSPVTTTQEAVTTGSVRLLAQNAARRQIDLQNLGPGDVHFRYGGAAATTGDQKLQPGERYSFPPGVSYGGEIWVVAATVTSDIVAVEYTE
jgi:hypothetical protein